MTRQKQHVPGTTTYYVSKAEECLGIAEPKGSTFSLPLEDQAIWIAQAQVYATLALAVRNA